MTCRCQACVEGGGEREIFPVMFSTYYSLCPLAWLYLFHMPFTCSPLLTKTVAKKKVAASTTTVTKSEVSTVLSPSKIPRLRTSGVKRLRSVSLERLSSDHMTKAKKTPKDTFSDGSSDEHGMTFNTSCYTIWTVQNLSGLPAYVVSKKLIVKPLAAV